MILGGQLTSWRESVCYDFVENRSRRLEDLFLANRLCMGTSLPRTSLEIPRAVFLSLAVLYCWRVEAHIDVALGMYSRLLVTQVTQCHITYSYCRPQTHHCTR